MDKFIGIIVLLAVLGMCSSAVDGDSSSGDYYDSSYEDCVSAELDYYASDPYYEYEGNEDMYTAMAESACE